MSLKQGVVQREPCVTSVMVACGCQEVVERCMRLGVRFRPEKQHDALPCLSVDAMADARLAN